jgi:hypothetical protein
VSNILHTLFNNPRPVIRKNSAQPQTAVVSGVFNRDEPPQLHEEVEQHRHVN